MHGTLARTTEQQVCGRVVLLVSCWSSVASLGRHAIPGAQAEAFAVPGVPSLIIADDITSY